MSRFFDFLLLTLLLRDVSSRELDIRYESVEDIRDRDCGWILFVRGVARVDIPHGLIEDSCLAVKQTVPHVFCGDSWRTGAHISGCLNESERNEIVRRVQSLRSLPRGAVIVIEKNLDVDVGTLYTQRKATLNLGRLDNADNKRDRIYRYGSTGKGVHVYVLDKEINIEHDEFKQRNDRSKSRASIGISILQKEDRSCAGHGTHVAGIVGGLKYGVAKDVNIIMVEVQPCSGLGSLRYVLKGLDWLLDHAKRPAVAQMSLIALGTSQSLNDMVQEVVNTGIPVVVSAGNYAANVAEFSPAMLESAIVVGNVDVNDVLQEKSNYGKTVDLFAPGVSIISASGTDPSGFQYLTGTSQAAPHVSGVIAQYLELNPTATPKEIERHLIRIAATGKIVDTKGSPNRILQTDLHEEKAILVQEEGHHVVASFEAFEFQPVVLYKTPGYEQGSSLVSITNRGREMLVIDVDVANATEENSSWMTVTIDSSSLKAQQTAKIEVLFDITDLSPGVYEATVVVMTNDVDHLITYLPVKLYVFCGRLALEQHFSDRPVLTGITLQKHANGSTESYRLSGVLHFHRPILGLNRRRSSELQQAMAVVGDGVIEELNDTGEAMCGTFSLRANFSIDQNSSSEHGQYRMTDFCIDILGNRLIDAYGAFVPETRICVPLEIKKTSVQWFGGNMIYSSDEGIVTNETDALLIVVFSNAIQPLTPSLFVVQPFEAARVTDVKPLDPTKRAFEIRMHIEKDFYGYIDVLMLDDIYNDASGRLDLEEELMMRFKRTAASVARHRGYMILQ